MKIVSFDNYEQSAIGFLLGKFINMPRVELVKYCALGLCEEAGEVAGKIKKAIRDDDGELDSERIEAIALTESRLNPDAVGTSGDSGVLQIRECYVAEINRIYGTHYTIEDAFDIEKSIEMFSLMQDYYNPEHDIDKAIYYHNKASWYRRKVMENYELVERYESLRTMLNNN